MSRSLFEINAHIRYILVLTVVLAISSMTPSAEAQRAEGTASGIFVNPDRQPNAVIRGEGTSVFRWGEGFEGSPPSSLRFQSASFDAAFDEDFSFGTLTYFNGAILADTGANAVDLQIRIMLTMPSGITEEISQTLTLINTPNVDDDPVASSDIVSLPNIPEVTFDVDGVQHTLNPSVALGSPDDATFRLPPARPSTRSSRL